MNFEKTIEFEVFEISKIFSNSNIFDNDVDLELLFLEFSLYIQIKETFYNIINTIQVFAKSRDYLVIKLRTKSHDLSKFKLTIEIMYVRYSKNNKILKFKVTKRKREITKITKYSFAIKTRENNDI